MSFMDELRSGKYNYTVNGKCSQCGACCGNILPIGDEDIKRIRNFLQDNDIQECKHFAPTAKPMEDETCPFRDSEKRVCTIYPARPEICRDYLCSLPQTGERLDMDKYNKQHTRLVNMRNMFFRTKG